MTSHPAFAMLVRRELGLGEEQPWMIPRGSAAAELERFNDALKRAWKELKRAGGDRPRSAGERLALAQITDSKDRWICADMEKTILEIFFGAPILFIFSKSIIKLISGLILIRITCRILNSRVRRI